MGGREGAAPVGGGFPTNSAFGASAAPEEPAHDIARKIVDPQPRVNPPTKTPAIHGTSEVSARRLKPWQRMALLVVGGTILLLGVAVWRGIRLPAGVEKQVAAFEKKLRGPSSFKLHDTLVTLVGTRMAAKDAIRSVCQQAGVGPIHFNSWTVPAMGAPGRSFVSDHLVGVPFWLAMHRLFVQTGYSPEAKQRYSGLRLGPYPVAAGPGHPWCFDKLFAVSVSQFGVWQARNIPGNQWKCEVLVNLWQSPGIFTEPMAGLTITQLQDRAGHSLFIKGSQHRGVKQGDGGWGSAMIMTPGSQFGCRAPHGKTVALLSGYVRLGIGVPIRHVLPSDSLKAQRFGPHFYVSIHSFGLDDRNDYIVNLRLRTSHTASDKALARYSVESAALFTKSTVTAVEPNGRIFGPYQMGNPSDTGGWALSTDAVFLRGCRAKPKSLVITYYPHSIPVRVPFTFRNLPINNN